MISGPMPAPRAPRRIDVEDEGYAVFSEGPIQGIRWEARSPDKDLAIQLAIKCHDTWGDRWYVVDIDTQKMIADFPAE